MAENAWSDHTLRGYGKAIAPLLNSGKLTGIDLHNYHDLKWANINDWDKSPQRDFDQIKKACGITRDIHLYVTEFNVKYAPSQRYQGESLDEETAAKYLFTAIFGNLCVKKKDGSPATQFALIWNMFHIHREDAQYGLCDTLNPWRPRLRGEVWRRVTRDILQGTRLSQIDAGGRKGVHIFTSEAKKIWVWHNLEGWTDRVGSKFRITEIPADSKRLLVSNWQGVQQTINIFGESSYRVTDLVPGQTYVFSAIKR